LSLEADFDLGGIEGIDTHLNGLAGQMRWSLVETVLQQEGTILTHEAVEATEEEAAEVGRGRERTYLLDGGRFLPAALSVAPFSTSTDFSVLVNILDSQLENGERTAHFGNRFDFVVRQRLLQRGGVILTIAPRGVVFTRDLEGGRIGGSVAAQYGNGKNLGVINLTYTGAIGGSPTNPKNYYQGSFDYYRTLSEKGVAVFAGFQHECSTGNPHAIGTEAGFVLPFRNGQVELASQQLSLNTHPAWQFQARVSVNWGKLLRR